MKKTKTFVRWNRVIIAITLPTIIVAVIVAMFSTKSSPSPAPTFTEEQIIPSPEQEEALQKAMQEANEKEATEARMVEERIKNYLAQKEKEEQEEELEKFLHAPATPIIVSDTIHSKVETTENYVEPETIAKTQWVYDITESDYVNLVLAIQHETGSNPDFYVNGDFDLVQQYMAKSILSRLGKPGFGANYTTAYTIYDILANRGQYKNMVNELWNFDPNNERTIKNLEIVLRGEDNLPDDLYFEDCSAVGATYWEAIEVFKSHYSLCKNFEVCYLSLTNEGRYIMFATNPSGAYAY